MGKGGMIVSEGYRILIIEDDHSIVEMLRNAFIREGFLINEAADGFEGLALFSNKDYDLVLVDLMLPGLDGMEIIRRIREKSKVPILIMSARDGDVDKALGLGFGADDYIQKPFSTIELSARMKAAIRRATIYSNSEQLKEPSVTIGNLELDLEMYSVKKSGKEVRLTAKEFDILKLFVTNKNRVFTKSQLYGLIWNDDYMGDENVINVHIRRLREKIEDDPSRPAYIRTLWGIGYKWEGG